MKKLLVLAVGIAALGFVGTASAADMPARMPAKAPMMMAPAYNWTGFYAGISGGYANERSIIVVTGPGAVDSGMFSGKGGLVGGTLGYNWAVPGGSWLLGLEADGSWSGVKSSGGACFPNCNIDVNWLATFRGRAGYVFGAWMPYVTGGLAVAGVHGSQAPANFDFRNTVYGWTLGGGLEAFIFPQWTVKAEYLYVALNSSDGNPIGVVPANQVGTGKTYMNVFRVGLNFHFN